MKVSSFWSAVGAVIFGLIIADLVTHPSGTQTISNGVVKLESNTGNQLIGKSAPAMSMATCAPCGREFTTVAAFDKHQDVDYRRRPAVACLDPATVGLTRDGRGRWHFRQTAAGQRYLENLRASRAVPL